MSAKKAGLRPPTGTITLGIILICIAVFWRGCWYATPMSEASMNAALSQEAKVGETHKALSQLKEMLVKKPAKAEAFLPKLESLVTHKTPQIRSTLAWVLGSAPKAENRKSWLMTLLEDEEKLVRFNAAVSLTAYLAPEARPVLHEMLKPTRVRAKVTGVMKQPRGQGQDVRFNLTLGRIELKNGDKVDVTSPIDGRLSACLKSHNAAVAIDDILFKIQPSDGQIENALIALNFYSSKADIAIFEQLARGKMAISNDARKLAQGYAERIRKLK